MCNPINDSLEGTVMKEVIFEDNVSYHQIDDVFTFLRMN